MRRAATLLSLVLVVLCAQTGGQAQATDALPYSTGYLLTGDYAVGSVDLVSADNGLSTGTIPMSGVPANADILAAFLYWETIEHPSLDPRQIADSVQFRGRPIKSVRVKSTGQPLSGNTAQCFASGSGSPLTITMFRADVLRLLPPQLDTNGKSTGKLLVNDADLASNALPRHTVTLPEVGNGNVVPDSAGASLVVVYRDPAQPLRKIVLYDGLHVATRGEVTTQTIRGFYQSDTTKKARLTHIVGSGAPNPTDALRFNDAQVQLDPFRTTSRSSDRSWGHVTVDVSALMTQATMSADYGETVTSRVTHGKDTPYECLTWGATIFSTTVLDADRDGIPDRLEQPGGPLRDPNGATLPDLYAMGARPDHKDFFGEVNAVRTTDPETRYGSASAPYESGLGPDGIPGTPDDTTLVESVGAPPHNHMPISQVIAGVGDALKNAPVPNPDGTTGIRAHFDVGDIGAYHALGADYAPGVGVDDAYLVPSPLARGGELTTETACDPGPTCRFPDYPGTVGWGLSLTQYMFDKFDRNRTGLFHYLLYAHSRGKARSSDGESPDFNVPSSSSGVGDLPGDRVIISLGRWDNFVGTPFMATSTTFHEIGHNLGLYHGGTTPTITRLSDGFQKFIEPNCKPNYLSVMSYLFQVRGLLDDTGRPNVNLSGAVLGDIDEDELGDGPISPALSYRTAWYAPLVDGSLGAILGTPAAKKFCNGLPFTTPGLTAPQVPMGRIDAISAAAGIDWDALGLLHSSGAQDINLDGSSDDELRGFNDWANIRLDQISGGHLMGDVSAGGQDFGGQDFGGQDFGGQDFGGQDFGGQDFGGQDFGGQDFGGLDVDGQDFGGQDFGGQDFGGDGELTLEDAEEVAGAEGSPPTEFAACVLGGNLPAPRAGVGTPACADASSPLHKTRATWRAPTFGTPVRYRVIRATGPALTDDNQVEIGTLTPAEAGCSATGQLCSFVDTEELPDGRPFTYFARADFASTTSDASDRRTITARNDAPVAVADARSTNEDTPLAGTLPGLSHVLVNDSDADSLALRPALVAGTTKGTLVFNADGTFTYAPNGDFFGADSFSYRLLGGVWPGDPGVPLSADSAIVTVTLTVNPVNDAPSFTRGADQTVPEDADPPGVPWATNFSPGPANESDQVVLAYQVIGNSNPALFAAGPAVANDGTLAYTPALNATGTASITVAVQDTGGTAFGGVNTSAAQTFTITVTPVNDAPVAEGQEGEEGVSTNEDTDTLITLTGSDVETDAGSLSVTITQAPLYGGLTGAWPTYTYTPNLNYSGSDSFAFTVTDLGDPDACAGAPPACSAALTSEPAVVSITINPINDAPAGADASVTTVQNTARIFAASDFGFTDPDDDPANNFSGIWIATPPTAGTLALTGEEGALGVGAFVTVEDLDAGRLTFIPALNDIGSPYASFTFQVQDDGGTAIIGDVDLDPTPNTMTINVTLGWVVTDATNCTSELEPETPDVTIDGNAVMMGMTTLTDDLLQDNCIHGASAPLPPLSGGNTKYSVTFRSKLFSWDAYNAPETLNVSGGYWDSFSVSLSKAPYAQLTLSDPLTTGQSSGDFLGAFFWGGGDFGDSILDCFMNPTYPTLGPGTCTDDIPAGVMTVQINGNPEGDTYLNVVLDTKTQPQSNHAHPSFGTIEILSVVQIP